MEDAMRLTARAPLNASALEHSSHNEERGKLYEIQHKQGLHAFLGARDVPSSGNQWAPDQETEIGRRREAGKRDTPCCLHLLEEVAEATPRLASLTVNDLQQQAEQTINVPATNGRNFLLCRVRPRAVILPR
jgi:hypothetical protein